MQSHLPICAYEPAFFHINDPYLNAAILICHGKVVFVFHMPVLLPDGDNDKLTLGFISGCAHYVLKMNETTKQLQEQSTEVDVQLLQK